MVVNLRFSCNSENFMINKRTMGFREMFVTIRDMKFGMRVGHVSMSDILI